MLRNLNSGKTLQNIVLLCLFVVAGCQPSLTPEEGMQRAEAYRDQANYSDAIIELKNVLRNSPRHQGTRLMLGELYLLQRDGDSAVTQLQKAKGLGPVEIDTRSSFGRALLLLEKYDRLLEEIVPEESDSSDIRADLLLLRGYAYIFKNNLQQADQLLSQALILNESNPAVLIGQAMVSLGNKNYEKASSQVEQALAIEADYMDAWVIKGRLALIQNQYKSAELAFGRAIGGATRGFTFLPPIQAHIYLVQSLIDQEKMKQASEAVEQLAVVYPGYPVLHYLRALIAYESGNFDKAGEHIQLIRSKVPDYDPALMLEGAINYALGNLERGNSALTTYLTRHPDNSVARKLLAAIRLKLQQPEQSYEVISPLLSQDPDNVELLVMASAAMRSAGKSEQSIALIEKALQQEPDNKIIKMQLASARLSNGDIDEAIRILQALPPTADKFGKRELMLLLAWSRKQDYTIALDFVDVYIAAHPKSPDVLAHSGVILMRMDKPDAARERFEKSLSLKPDNAGVFYALAKISATQGDKDKAITWLERTQQASESALEPRLMLVKYYLEQGNITRAREISIEATMIAPERADVWFTYSVVQNSAGDPHGAVDSLLKAEKLKPGSKTILMRLVRSQVSASDMAGASETLRKLLKLSPDNFQVASMLAVIEMKLGNVKHAFDISRKQQSLTGNRLNALTLEGDLHMMAGEPDKAVDVYQSAAKISSSTALTTKLYLASRKTALAKPERLLLEWLQKHPQDTAIRLLLASEYLASGDTARAIQEYKTHLALKPDSPDVLNNLALAYHSQKNQKAVSTAEKAHRLKPDSAAIKDTLGWILVQGNDVKRGLPLLRDALAQLPDNMEVQYHYAVALAESGDQSGAHKILQKLVSSKSNFTVTEDAKKYLQTLTP